MLAAFCFEQARQVLKIPPIPNSAVPRAVQDPNNWIKASAMVAIVAALDGRVCPETAP